jgi:hypothetical protein
MSEFHTVYRAQGKEIGLVFLFKYDLNGNLTFFEIAEGKLNDQQIRWLFSGSNFPADETIMKTVWMKEKKYQKVFDIEKSLADLSFETLWKLYNHKVAKFHAQQAFKKLKEEAVIKCFVSIKGYHKYLQKTKIAQAHLASYINGRYYEDDWEAQAKK